MLAIDRKKNTYANKLYFLNFELKSSFKPVPCKSDKTLETCKTPFHFPALLLLDSSHGKLEVFHKTLL